MRFRQRTNVDLPHPDGPISAVASLGDVQRDVLQRVVVAIPRIQGLDLDADAHS